MAILDRYGVEDRTGPQYRQLKHIEGFELYSIILTPEVKEKLQGMAKSDSVDTYNELINRMLGCYERYGFEYMQQQKQRQKALKQPKTATTAATTTAITKNSRGRR